MDDERIVELYWDRDESAISESSLKYGAYCTSIAHNILFNTADAEECVNDTWLTASQTVYFIRISRKDNEKPFV